VFSAVVGFEKFGSFKIVSQNHKILQELLTLWRTVCVCVEREREREREREKGGGGREDSQALQCVSRTTIFQELLTLKDHVSVSSDGGGGDGGDGSLICKLHHGFPEPSQSFKSCYLWRIGLVFPVMVVVGPSVLGLEIGNTRRRVGWQGGIAADWLTDLHARSALGIQLANFVSDCLGEKASSSLLFVSQYARLPSNFSSGSCHCSCCCSCFPIRTHHWHHHP
jgi:hypothetical protein